MIFTLLPILLLACAQLAVAVLLLAPSTIASPAVKLCKLSQSPVGQTCLATVSVFLLVLLIPPVRCPDVPSIKFIRIRSLTVFTLYSCFCEEESVEIGFVTRSRAM